MGYVYEGLLPFKVGQGVSLIGIPTSKTEIMINLGNPEGAFFTSFIPNDGVGLARLEVPRSQRYKCPSSWPSSAQTG